MDLADVQSAIEMAGFPKAVVDAIWKKSGNKEYVDNAIRKAKCADR